MENEGFLWYFNNKLLSLSSASNYTGTRDNFGAVAVVNENLEVKLSVYKC